MSPHNYGLEEHFYAPHRPYGRIHWLDMDEEIPLKIIILGDKNLEVIKGYKAQVSVTTLSNEVVIRITGQSPKFASLMINSLEALPEEEIHGDNGSPKKKRTRKSKKNGS